MKPSAPTSEPGDAESEMTVEEVLAIPVPGYQWPLDVAKRHARSRQEPRLQTAVALLREMTGLYPHALAVGQELVLALIELNRVPEAEAELTRLENTFRGLDMELLCRWGRLFKDKGDEQGETEMAEQYYRESIKKYDRAYSIADDHYPGINKATLMLILAAHQAVRTGTAATGALDDIDKFARTLLENASRWISNGPEDEQVWIPATRGEANLLRQDWWTAEAEYRRALESPQCTPHARDAIGKQIRRILDAFKKLKVVPPAPFDNIETYVTPASAKP